MQVPQHATLQLLLDQKQFHACRLVVEKLIDDLMDVSQAYERPEPLPFTRCQERDVELALLYLMLSKCQYGMHEWELAATHAEASSLLARKAGDLRLHAEALHTAGVCHIQAGNYPRAVQVLTQALDHAQALLRVKGFFNRGHAYERMCAFQAAASDYDAGLRLADGTDENMARLCRINLAWVLILTENFSRAEAVLVELEAAPGESTSELVRAHVSHDRLHMAYLRREHKLALSKAIETMQQLPDQHPHVKAQIAMTIMDMMADHALPEQAITIGLLVKRLAALARRPDLDEAASRRLQSLESTAGTPCLVQSLQRLRQVAPLGSRHRMATGDRPSGGTG